MGEHKSSALRARWAAAPFAAGLLTAAHGCNDYAAPSEAALDAPTVGVQYPLELDTRALTPTDRLDVGYPADEAAHAYVIDDPTFVGVHRFDLPEGRGSYWESGRATRSFESFHVKVQPGRDHVLVKMFDTYAREQAVLVRLDKRLAGEWKASPSGEGRYGESSFSIPADFIGQRQVLNVRIDYLAGAPDVNSFVYWMFASSLPHILHPIATDVSDLALTDHLDVGEPQSETSHQYTIDNPTWHGVTMYEWPAQHVTYEESLRATKSFESFRLRVIPGRDHVLVKAIDTLSKDQRVRVLVDDTLIGADWDLPNGPERYDEGTLNIPAALIGNHEQVTLRVQFVSASLDTNSLAYWMYARP